jgi:hypothetical protein
LGCLLAVCLAAGALWAIDDDARPVGDQWADHPAVQPFAVDARQLPAEIYLVRTRGQLPDAPGVVVHGQRGGVYLVSGDADVVMGLAQRGCAVIPLRGLSSTEAAAVSGPTVRQWERIDTPDPAIAAMVAQVDSVGVFAKIQWLVDFGTRYCLADNNYAVTTAIGDAFSGYGLTPILRPFEHSGKTMWNVEAIQLGTVYPDSFFIIGGHFDSISDNSRFDAPGADDNGTGTTAVLTAAEILTQYDFECSIRYVCFNAEERGLIGSQAYAAWAESTGMKIGGMLNFDMMGYWEPGVEMDLEIETNVASQWLAAVITNAADLYTGAPYELHVYDGAWWGDHASFWDQGYAAVNHEESWDWGDPDFNPYYHTTQDLPQYVGAQFVVGNIQVGVAALATLAVLDPGGTGVDDPARTPAFAGALSAYPNPFSERVTLTVSGVPDRETVRVVIYDARGRRVDEVSVVLHNGRGTTVWAADDVASPEISSGVYFAKLADHPGAIPVKIVFVK